MNKFNPYSDILALDFDGVVIDSIEECLVVGYNALAIQQGRPDRISLLNDLNSGIILEARRIRNFIRHGQDYVYIHLALQQKISIKNQADFDRFIDKQKFLNTEIRRLFYTERARFLQDEPEQWLTLNPFYPGMQEFLGKFQPKERLYIITTKLKENVQAVMDAAEIDMIPEHIYSADNKLSKSEIILQMLQKLYASPDRFHFIDDQVDTLIKSQSTGVNLYLAEWGYNNYDQVDLAYKNGLVVLTLENFYRLFGGSATPEGNK